MRAPSKVLSLTVSVALAASVALFDVPIGSAATISAGAKEAFVASVVSPAQKAQRAYGVPASVSIAQAILASDWGTSAVAKKAKNYFDTRCSASMTPAQFAKVAEAQVGKPYVLGAEAAISNSDPAKFDCSELVEWLFGRSGNRITDLAAAQYNATKKVTGSPKVGDLVFLRNNPARSNGIGHVAILTKKLDGGDWRIIEARGRASGVVRTTLSYWKQRSYYAGLRRSSTFVLAGSDGISASASSSFQAGCLSVSGTKYSQFTSLTNSFAAHAAAVSEDSAYSAARKVIADLPAYISAVAKVEQPKGAAAYAARIKDLMAQYDLRDYDVVPFSLVLDTGDTGAKVTATQYLLGAAGYTVSTTGRYDSATAGAIKKFQKSKGLEADGEAGPLTLTSLTTRISSGAQGGSVSALNTLLRANGYAGDNSSSFGAGTVAAVKAFQADAGRPVTGAADDNTWAALYMTLAGPTPRLSGKAVVGQTLTASPGTWGPGSVGLAYQWYRGDAKISGATRPTYAITVADAGSALRVRVVGVKRMHTTTVRFSASTATVPLLQLSATPTPTLSGKASVGQRLTATAGTWSPAPVTLAYQWYRGTTKIGGATDASFTITDREAGSSLKVAVTATKTGYVSVTRTSAPSATVPKLLTGPTPTIAGTAKVGSVLTARPGTWAPAKVALSYQWYRGASAIKGATKARYLLHTSEVGQPITVTVTGRLGGYSSVTRTATPTEAVAKGTLKAKTPKISGTRRSGHVLKVNGGNWGPGAVKLTYQWYRGSAAVSGATRASFRLTAKDKGKTLSVVVLGSKSGYDSQSMKVGVTIAR